MINTENWWSFSNLTLDRFLLLFISSLALLISGVRYCLEKRKPRKIKTKLEADNFLNEYCIEIVNAIKEAYETQIISVKNNDLRRFGEQGRWIGGLSDIYSKLCKK